MRAALGVEGLKLRRAMAPRVAGLAVGVGVPALAAAFMAVAVAGGDSTMAAKVRPLVEGAAGGSPGVPGWGTYLALVGQVLSVAVLLGVGVVVAWSFGREHTDGTFAALFALPTRRRDIALAKLAVLVVWGAGVGVVAVLVAVPLGVAVGLGAPDGETLVAAARAVLVGALMTLLTVPLALCASVWRGYLPAIGALLGLVVATQVATVAGAGAWFPYAAPGLWLGMGGAAAADVSAAQLGLAVPVAVLAAVATAAWWSRAEV